MPRTAWLIVDLGDLVVGVVSHKHPEYYRVDINAPELATLRWFFNSLYDLCYISYVTEVMLQLLWVYESCYMSHACVIIRVLKLEILVLWHLNLQQKGTEWMFKSVI